MTKTEVYSWRISPHLKAALEEEARARGTSVAALLDAMAEEWLETRGGQGLEDEEVQRRLQAAAAKSFGTIGGGDPDRSARTRELVRRRLTSRRAR